MRAAFSLAIAGVFALLFSAQAQAQTYTFTADLSGGNEVPGVVTGAGGTATITLNVTAGTVSWVIDVYNLPSGVTAGHIHAGSAGVAGPVVINFNPTANLSNDFRISGTANLSDLTARDAQGINSAQDFVQMMLNEDAYVNVHSQVNPGGEIRGQVRLVTQF
jgi:hypothetical protein